MSGFKKKIFFLVFYEVSIMYTLPQHCYLYTTSFYTIPLQVLFWNILLQFYFQIFYKLNVLKVQ